MVCDAGSVASLDITGGALVLKDNITDLLSQGISDKVGTVTAYGGAG